MADATLTDTALAVLEDPNVHPAAVADSIAIVAGARPALRIDITDPPSQPVAILGELEVAAATPDDALVALGAELADQARATQAELAAAGAAASDALAAAVAAADGQG